MYIRKRSGLYLLAGLLLAAILSGCGPTPEPTPTPIEVTPGNEVIQGQATVESVELRILESFPVQVHAVVRGFLADGCTTLDEVIQQLEGNTFYVTITTVRPADAVCTEALVPFEQIVPLAVEGLPAGTYTVDANGVTATFSLDVDNVLPDTAP
jgi:inhibitor of cysteine peptidase